MLTHFASLGFASAAPSMQHLTTTHLELTNRNIKASAERPITCGAHQKAPTHLTSVQRKATAALAGSSTRASRPVAYAATSTHGNDSTDDHVAALLAAVPGSTHLSSLRRASASNHRTPSEGAAAAGRSRPHSADTGDRSGSRESNHTQGPEALGSSDSDSSEHASVPTPSPESTLSAAKLAGMRLVGRQPMAAHDVLLKLQQQGRHTTADAQAAVLYLTSLVRCPFACNMHNALWQANRLLSSNGLRLQRLKHFILIKDGC